MNQIEMQQDARARAPLGAVRHDWTVEEILALFRLPFPELIYTAQSIHRRHFDPDTVQFAQLLSIKTGGCPEDCGYCAQSAHFETGVKATKLMANEEIVAEARRARESGATRFCMGAAWRSPKDRDVDHLCSTIEAVKGLGMETCMTLGMLTGRAGAQAEGRRARLLQPQPRHLARALRQDHHHAHLRRPAGDAGACARSRHGGVLRRHPRHRRDASATAPPCCASSPICPSIPRACRSTC